MTRWRPDSAGPTLRRGRSRPRAPWLLVVARGHARLVAELQAMFRDDPRVQVIENRREGHALLPRSRDAVSPRAPFPSA